MESLEVAPEIGQSRFREFDLFINEFSSVFFFSFLNHRHWICSAYLLYSTKGLGDVAFCEEVRSPELVFCLPLGLGLGVHEERAPCTSWHSPGQVGFTFSPSVWGSCLM